MLAHPEVALRSCADCAKWIYQANGEIQKARGKPVPRGSALTPCWKCPKKSPQEAKHYELSGRNMQTLLLYRQVRATSGNCLSDQQRADPVLIKNLGIVDRLIRQHERQSLADGIATEVSKLIATAPLTSSRRR